MKKIVFLLLLLGLFVPWATHAQTPTFYEDFEGGSLPTGWTVESDGSGTWGVEAGDCDSDNPVDAGEGDYNALICHSYSGTVTKLITPVLNLASLTSPQLSFMHIQRNWSGDQDELRVYYRTSATSDWVQLCEYTDDISIWTTEEEIALPTTTYQIAFEMTDGYGFGVAIDAVTIDEAPACPRPTNLEVNYTLGATSATMSWNGTATSYNIDVNGTVTTGVTSPYSLSGLVFETTYTVRVQANCGSDGLSNWSTVTFTPTDRIRIGTGIEANFLLPTHPGYNYSLTEQIYTTSELGDEGDILNLEFYKVGTDACSRDLDIYMVSTTESEFGVENWIPVTASDLVYSGMVTFNDDAWTSITLTTPFEYDGVNNVAIVVYDHTEDYLENVDVNFLTFEPTSTQAVFFFSDDNSFDPTSDFSSFSNNSDYWNNLSEKNQIRIFKASTCRPPIGLAVNNVGNTSATLVWTDRNTTPASSWKVQISTDDEFPTGTPELTPTMNGQYDFTGLTAETTYYVRVKADCGVDGESRWSAPISFIPYCAVADQCFIYYDLLDGYGQYGAYIRVYDENTGRELDYWWDSGNGGEPEADKDASDHTGTLSGLCPGQRITFELNETGETPEGKGRKDGEPEFIVYDRNEEEIFTSDDVSPSFTWEVECNVTTCRRPTGLVLVTPGMTSATVSWNGDATLYNIDVNGTVTSNVTLTNGTYTISGLTGSTSYTVKVQAKCGTTAEPELSSWSRPITFTTDPCEDMCEISYELSDDYNWNGFQLQVWDAVADTQLAFWDGSESNYGSLRVCDGGQLRFIFVQIYSGYNASYCTYAVYDANYQEIFSGSGTFSDVNYTVNCHACPFPTGLEVSDVTASSATLSWSLNDGAVNTPQSYTVRYRKTGETATFYDDFENDPSSTWTTIDADGDGNNWTWGITESNLNPKPYHSGTGRLSSSSYSEDPDNWLVTPQITLQGTVKVWLRKGNSSNYDNCQILVSTNGNTNIEDFTPLDVTGSDLSTTYREFTADLSAYNQQQGYIAIRHYRSQYQWGLSVDDFGVYVPQNNEWTTTTVTDATTLAIQGLDPSTTYEWEVLANCGQSNESLVASSSFTTLPPSIAYEADKWYAISAPTHQEWQRYTTLSIDQSLYRLYQYDESWGKWQSTDPHGQLMSGRGYIYRQGDEGSLTFNGMPNSGNYPNAQTLTNSCTDDALKGFNLIGNPYTHPIYKGGAFPTTGLVSGYYSLNPDGSWIARTNSVPIAMGQGVLVKVSSSVTEPISLSFTDVATPASSKGADDQGLQFTVEGFGHSDVAYAFLSEGEGLNKIGHISEGLPTLSIPVADRRYALAHVGADCKQFDLHFRAAASGSHTLTLSAEKRPAYLHLIDRQTGADIDLLANGSYTFDATPVDAQNRFLVKLAPGGELPSSTFAFQTDNGMLIEGTGTLQAYDVMGRQLFVREVASQLSIPKSQFPGTGVYILRLGEKSQKIVIK